MGDYVIGVDGGTEGIRAGVFDVEGNPVAIASSPYATDFPRPGWAEQNPEEWWDGLGKAVREAMVKSGLGSESIRSIGIDTTCCTVLALDKKGLPLRPCLLWMDMRSANCADQVLATGDDALRVNSGGAGPVSAEWMIPKALWLKQNEPELYNKAHYVCEYQDFINFRLTGRMVASINNASVRWHYSSKKGWPTTMLAKLGMEDLSEKWPQEVVGMGAVVGGLTDEAAKHLGLRAGLTVAQGGADAFVGMVGLGVVRPGELALLTGSSHLHLGLTDSHLEGPGMWGTYPDAVLPGLGVVEGGQTSTGSIVAWFRRLISGEEGEPVPYEDLNREAEVLPIGAEGLVCLDHFQGNRTPFTDPLSKGAITGLTLKHGRGHIFRALIEGVCLGTEAVFEAMRAAGFVPESIAVAGGATRSPMWLQIHADVSNVPLRLTKVPDACLLGSAILAAVGSGLYQDIRTAVDAMVQVERTVMPDPASYLEYRELLGRYRLLYPSLKPIFQPRASLAKNSRFQEKSIEAASEEGSIVVDSVMGEALVSGGIMNTEACEQGEEGQVARCLGGGMPLGIVNASILAADMADLAGEVSRVVAGWLRRELTGSILMLWTIDLPSGKPPPPSPNMLPGCSPHRGEPRGVRG